VFKDVFVLFLASCALMLLVHSLDSQITLLPLLMAMHDAVVVLLMKPWVLVF
jgi:hypothetical protein